MDKAKKYNRRGSQDGTLVSRLNEPTPDAPQGYSSDEVPFNVTTSRIEWFIAQSHVAAGLYWTRNNVFLTIQTFALAGTFSLLTKGDPSPVRVVPLTVLGWIFCFIWVRVNKMSRYYQLVFVADARRLAIDAEIADDYYYSLGFHDEQKFPEQFRPEREIKKDHVRRPEHSATWWMFGVIGVFAAGWLLVAVLSFLPSPMAAGR